MNALTNLALERTLSTSISRGDSVRHVNFAVTQTKSLTRSAKAIVIACVTVIAFVFIGNVIADELTDRVSAAFDRESSELKATIISNDEIHLETPKGSVSVFLDRARAECARRPQDCDSTVKTLVEATVATLGRSNNLGFNAEEVYPVVRPAASLASMRSTIGDDAVARMFLIKPYISNAVVLYAIDTPKALRFVNTDDLERAGLTPDALNTLAVANVSKLQPIKIAPVSKAPGLWSAVATDGYGTSRLFDPRFWDVLETQAGGPVAVALPTRDWLLAARLDDPASIARLRVVAGRIAASEPTAVTSSLVRRDGQGWTEVLP